MSLKIAFDTIPDPDNLRSYVAFDEKTRIVGITERLKSILGIMIHEMEDRKEVMAKLKEIGPNTKDIFEKTTSEDGKKLEYYYGIDLKALMIADVELPKELKEATARQEAVKKENDTKQMQIDKIKELARGLVVESKNKLPFEVALEFIQMEFGKGNVKKEIHKYDLGRGTQEIVLKFLDKLPELLNARRP